MAQNKKKTLRAKRNSSSAPNGHSKYAQKVRSGQMFGGVCWRYFQKHRQAE